MLNTPFSPWPCFSNDEADAVRNVLLSNRVNYWTGQECRLFEQEFADWAGAKYAVAVANGTVALDLALLALAIGPGDEVIVTPRTFIASISCVVNARATPVFADVDPESGNISAATIARVLSPRTKAVICVHLAGWPCDMDPIMALASAHGFRVIEDCAQAHGARYKGRSVGSIGHVGAWSFCQDKIMTTGGEGGMVTTHDEPMWQRMWSFKDHGKSYAATYEREHPPGFRWLHDSFGTNGRMLEIQAVIGRIQLTKMALWTRQRNANAQVLAEVCRKYPLIRVPDFPASAGCAAPSTSENSSVHAYYKFYVYVRSEYLAEGWSRDRIVDAINAADVPCFQGTCSEVYLEKAFDGTGWRPVERLRIAQELGETSLMFLVHPTINDDELRYTCSMLDRVFKQAARPA